MNSALDRSTVRHPAATDAVKRKQDDGERICALQDDILRTLLYFDIFDHPLRLPEILQFLPSYSVTLKDLRSALSIQPLSDLVMRDGEFYYLRSQPGTIVGKRIEKERRAVRMMNVARLVSSIVGRLPFVRAVFVSGELSKGVASKKSDIDFVIATAKNRVWIVRTLCTLLKKTILFNRKKFFCYNHIVSEDRLEVVDRNLYTAMEVVTLVPMINPALYKKFLNANTWTRAFLPNLCLSEPAEPSVERGISPAERFINAVVPSNTLDSVDRWLMMKWRRAWIRRYPGLSPAKRGQLFQSTPDVSTAYAGDFFQSIMGQYELRLRACDLVPPVEFSDNRIKSPTPSLSIL